MKFSLSIVYVLFCASSFAQNFKSFPQHVLYTSTIIKPNVLSQDEMDRVVENFYDSWKSKYLKTAGFNEKYISTFDVTDFEEKSISPESTSEGQGYGMMIVALMAGYDKKAQSIYDSLFRFYRNHICRKISDSALMIWSQNKNLKDMDSDAAPDGDMDIAYSLLLADGQWGSSGKINYRRYAINMIHAISKYEINKNILSVKLSNAIEDQTSSDYYSMRSSDFMPSHFRAFFTATHDSIWLRIIDTNYSFFHYIQSRYSPAAGLMPDYIINLDRSEPRPDRGEKGSYDFNACRVPWRIALDFLLDSNVNSKNFCNKMNHWLIANLNKPLYNINEGYELNGKPLTTQDDLEKFEAMKFLCPFTISLMVSNNQVFLNKLWTMMIHFNMETYRNLDYYDNTIKMICLIILSNNYWTPGG